MADPESSESPILAPENHPEDLAVRDTAAEIAKHFPDYTTIDRSSWDNYTPHPSPMEDIYRVLGFSRGERSPKTPELRVLFKKPEGKTFTINVVNNPLGFGSETHLATP